jgi:hypothetical protein
MKVRRAEPMKPRMLAAYLEGEVTPSEASTIEAELAESAGTRRRLSRLREIGEALSAPIPEVERVDLVVPWRRVVADRARAPWGGWRRIPGMLAVAAAIVAVAVVARRPPSAGERPPMRTSVDEFRAKSAAPGNNRERWSGIRVYRVDGGGEARRLADRLHASDGLVFSYTNLGPAPLEHLMVFGIDARGTVLWFYPAYDREDENPESISIEKGGADVPLPDIIRNDLAPGPLAIHAVFSDRVLRVLEVEALLRDHPDPMAPLPLAGVVEHIVAAVVEP